MCPILHLAWSTCRATETFAAGWRKLLRKVERKMWLCCSFFIKLTAWGAKNLLALRQINQSECCISSTRNKCFCCGSSWSCKVKSAKLATKQCCATSCGFLYFIFRCLIKDTWLMASQYLTQLIYTSVSASDYQMLHQDSSAIDLVSHSGGYYQSRAVFIWESKSNNWFCIEYANDWLTMLLQVITLSFDWFTGLSASYHLMWIG